MNRIRFPLSLIPLLFCLSGGNIIQVYRTVLRWRDRGSIKKVVAGLGRNFGEDDFFDRASALRPGCSSLCRGFGIVRPRLYITLQRLPSSLRGLGWLQLGVSGEGDEPGQWPCRRTNTDRRTTQDGRASRRTKFTRWDGRCSTSGSRDGSIEGGWEPKTSKQTKHRLCLEDRPGWWVGGMCRMDSSPCDALSAEFLQAKTVVGPLDRVKILFQASSPQFAKYTGHWFGVVTAMRDINRQDGLRGLFRGHAATLLRIFPYAAIKFVAYEQIRYLLISSPAQETPIRRLLSGSFAGITSVFFTYPLEVIRVRLAFETRKDSRNSLSSICRQIFHEQPPNVSSKQTRSPVVPAAVIAATTPKAGLMNFYRGFSPTLAGMLPYAGMSFLTHDTVTDWLRLAWIAPYTTTFSIRGSDELPILTAWAQLFAGGIAGLVSQTSSYPLEVIRRRMQVGGAVGDRHRLGMAETARKIYTEAGWRGFWVGLTIGYVKVVPMVAISFFVYERMKTLLGV